VPLDFGYSMFDTSRIIDLLWGRCLEGAKGLEYRLRALGR